MQKNWRKINCNIVWEFSTEKQALDYEVKLVSKLKEKYPNRCMNFTLGGEGTSGYQHTNDAKTKIRMATTGREYSQKTRDKLRMVWLNKSLSESHKRKISRSVGKWIVCMRTGMTFSSVKECAEFWGISTTHVSSICSGSRVSPTHKFEYMDKVN